MSAFSSLSDRKQIEDLLWTKTRTRGRGRQKIQGGNLQQEVVRNGSPIKWSTPLPLMATVKRHNMSGRRDGENITHKSERQVLMQYMKSCPQKVYIMKKCNL